MFSEVALLATLPAKLSFKNSSNKPDYIPLGKFERLPKWLNCIPLLIQWFYLSFLYKSITLPSSANPNIKSGGLVGEGKLEYFESMGVVAKKFIADYIPITASHDPIYDSLILKQMQEKSLSFPVIVKPNIGWCGYGVRLIYDLNELRSYYTDFPKGETFLIQKYLPETGEAGLFYVRHPDKTSGRLIGLTLRYFPQVTGNGIHTVGQLISYDPRLKRIEKNILHDPDYDPNHIPAMGEIVRLSTIGSTRVGGLYCNGSEYITPALNKAVDMIARDMKDFHIGRFDVRYENLDLLREGQGFKIMEVNGSGSEAVHAWDPKYSIAESYRIIFAKQRLLFHISQASKQKGYKPIGLYKLAKLHFHQQKLIKLYPLSN